MKEIKYLSKNPNGFSVDDLKVSSFKKNSNEKLLSFKGDGNILYDLELRKFPSGSYTAFLIAGKKIKLVDEKTIEEFKKELKIVMKNLGFKEKKEKEIKIKKLNLDKPLNIIEKMVKLGYKYSEENTRKWHNKHNSLNGINSLEILFKNIEEKEEIETLEKYYKELKKEIKENKEDKKYIKILFKRLFEEIDDIYFSKDEKKRNIRKFIIKEEYKKRNDRIKILFLDFISKNNIKPVYSDNKIEQYSFFDRSDGLIIEYRKDKNAEFRIGHNTLDFIVELLLKGEEEKAKYYYYLFLRYEDPLLENGIIGQYYLDNPEKPKITGDYLEENEQDEGDYYVRTEEDLIFVAENELGLGNIKYK